MDIRLGNGFDVHAFEAGKFVILGGIKIPHTFKLCGHSDADVVLHAITDAIFGALAEGDIGTPIFLLIMISGRMPRVIYFSNMRRN